MLKNKKNISIIAIVLIAIIGLLFAGCSKDSADMPTTPQESFNKKNISCKTVDNYKIDSPLFDIVVIGNNGYIIKNFLNNATSRT
ncbi:hypothetical protein J7L48_00220, partial [bacterium]|nr:hypothetical protein [bacterium]